jgi:molecular chaperone GrpE
MAEEKQTAGEVPVQEDEVMENELDFDGETPEDIESAMQEALAAVETARAKREGGDEIRLSGQPAVGTADPDEVAKLEETVAELRDRSQRTLADFENFRRRVDRERQEDRRFAAFDVLREFLAVVDNLERALASEGSTDDLKVGVELIHRQMKDLMKNAGVERISALGEEFDPRFHEAVGHHEDAAATVPTVSSELQAGYVMHDRLLRPSVVKVAMPAEGDDRDRQEN